METSSQTEIHGLANTKVVYKLNKALFGMLEWYSEQRSEVVGRDIYMFTEHPVDTVYLNGKAIWNSPQE